MLRNEKRINGIIGIAWAAALLLGIIIAVWQGGNSLLPEATPDINTTVKCGVAALLAVNLLLMLQTVLMAFSYRRQLKPQLYQVLGLVFFTISLLAECFLSSAFFSNSPIAAGIAAEFLCLAFIPFVIFIADSTQLPPLPKVVVCGLILINFIVQNILALTGTYALGSLPWLTHGANAICLMLGAYAITQEHGSKQSRTNMLAVSTLLFTACYVLEIIANNDHNLILMAGLALFLAIILMLIIKTVSSTIAQDAYEQQMTDLAMVDYQTGFESRLAFNNYYYNLDEHYKGVITLGVMVIDLNNLKDTNDRYGHAAGDDLILGAAECIRETFGDTARYFRNGGDEFAIVAVGNDVNMETAMTRLDSQIIHFNANNVHQLSMARGICIDETEVDDMKKLHIIYKAAEDRMYTDKIDNHEQIKVQMIQETYLKKQMLQEQMIREKQFQEQMQRVAEAKHAEDMKKYLAKQMAENHTNNSNDEVADTSNENSAAADTPPSSQKIPEILRQSEDMREQDFNPIFPPIDDSVFWGDKKERKEQAAKEKPQPKSAAESTSPDIPIPPITPITPIKDNKPKGFPTANTQPTEKPIADIPEEFKQPEESSIQDTPPEVEQPAESAESPAQDIPSEVKQSVDNAVQDTPPAIKPEKVAAPVLSYREPAAKPEQEDSPESIIGAFTKTAAAEKQNRQTERND